MADASVDAIVTDPPYELGFMGKTWDASGIAYDVTVWREALRVLKPGGHLLAFGGSRTYHRLACAVEDAGFEIRDQIMWLYGSGFPKSHNGPWGGTALKPAHEPIVVARKPLAGTVAANVQTHGTGALNIDGCRVEANGRPLIQSRADVSLNAFGNGLNGSAQIGTTDLGRWPANVIHDGSDEVIGAFPNAPGQIADAATGDDRRRSQNVYGVMTRGSGAGPARHDAGSAARFFYCAKASKADRNEGNGHPTVKPTELMRYLCRLVTPPGGLVLDPFTGSGSTGKAARLEGFRFLGCEQSEEYAAIARARIGCTEADAEAWVASL